MIVSLRGKLVKISEKFLVIDTNGVGYRCYITLQTYGKYLNSTDEEISISTHFHVTAPFKGERYTMVFFNV